ncbi:MAG: hypothetical protein AABY16_00410 [Nanoarchaeota archaeon]
MNKLCYLILFLLIIPASSAITTNMAKTYQPGETMIIKNQGNILQPITPNNILFKRAHVAIAVIYDVKRIGTEYYLYAQLPLQPNNYSLFINDIATTVNGIVTTIDFNQSFSVAGNIVDYSISPGFAIVSNTLTLNSILNLDQPTTININFPEEQAFTLQPGTNTITLSTSSVAPGVYQATVGRYTLPIQVINTSSPSNQTAINNNFSIQITPPAIRATALANNQTSYIFSILNTGGSTINNLILSYNTNLMNVTPYFVSSLQPNSSQQFNLSLNRLSGSPIATEIIVQIGSYNKSIPINISFTANANQTTQINDTTPQYYCSELGGRFCTASEICSTDPVQTLDGSCCTGTCETESSGGFGWVGYVSIAVIIIVLIIIYLLYKKSSIPKPKDLTAPPSRTMPSPPPNKIQLPPGFPSRQPIK